MIPNFEEKYGDDAVFTPSDALNAQGEGVVDVPPAVILGYQDELTDAVRERANRSVSLVGSQTLFWLSETVGYVPVHEAGIGAPVSGIVTENVVAGGADAVVMLGGCACLNPEIPPDAAILPTTSVRDEGVSHHYLRSDDDVEATPDLVDDLDDALGAAGFDTPRGRTWTTSAMYRETGVEVEHYRENGAVSLCMESAAIWAVCKYRGAAAATVHQIGDYLAPNEWTPESGGDAGLREMLTPSVEALTKYVERAQ
ncbi:hypothetical protein [Salarchaeum japonicum]|uniref:phosphorylase family protein n=1 Tax=Salarchaeum japonicum TaxID=555573 RepID=UPI003C796D60